MLGEDRALAREHLGSAPDVPVVRALGHDAQRDLLAAAADHQLGMRLLHRLGIERRVGELVVAALEGGAALRPQRRDDLARLVQPLQPLAQGIERNAVRLVLVLLPAGAEAEQQPPARDDVDLRGHLGHDGRVAVGVAEHDRAHAHARHQRGQRAERAQRFQHRALTLLRVGQEVIGHAGDVPARRLQVFPEVQDARPRLPTGAREDHPEVGRGPQGGAGPDGDRRVRLDGRPGRRRVDQARPRQAGGRPSPRPVQPERPGRPAHLLDEHQLKSADRLPRSRPHRPHLHTAGTAGRQDPVARAHVGHSVGRPDPELVGNIGCSGHWLVCRRRRQCQARQDGRRRR